ncbi:hypothetical protein N836_06605 [Leptolyngbya sp. Heron Island J]|nr:hypothetical protein N836_06605 [Leptolyngbya sp. Heron Island J]
MAGGVRMSPDRVEVATEVIIKLNELMIRLALLVPGFGANLTLVNNERKLSIKTSTQGQRRIPAIKATGNIKNPTRPLH